MKRIRGDDLVIIEDLMYMVMDQSEANLFFHLVNHLYERSSIIVTSNKRPEEWGELLGDPESPQRFWISFFIALNSFPWMELVIELDIARLCFKRKVFKINEQRVLRTTSRLQSMNQTTTLKSVSVV